MKILWFTLTPSCYKPQKDGYNGGGWISSLEQEIKKQPELSLGVAFLHNDSCFKTVKGGVAYYPMARNNSLPARAKRFFCLKQDEMELALCQRVIDDFKPDIIHVFGTESSFGLICKHTSIPVIIHLQGLMAPYINAWIPPFFSLWDYFKKDGCSPLKIAFTIRSWFFNVYAAKREQKIMSSCRYFMGRTAWDKAYVELNAPDAKYFHCDEMLRDVFYLPEKRCATTKLVFISTLSPPLYKGHDLVLKTAKILTEQCSLNFEWKIYGVNNIKLAEKKTRIKADFVNLTCMRRVSAEELKQDLLSCSIYIHPSYIDNSPNSLCEAQVLGVPIIATNVGGVSSLITDKHDGLLVPANDPVMIAKHILALTKAPELAEKMSQAAKEAASSRHSKHKIINTILRIYNDIKNTPRESAHV